MFPARAGRRSRTRDSTSAVRAGGPPPSTIHVKQRYGADLAVAESGKVTGNATRRALQALMRLSPRSERASLGDASYASGPSHGQPLGRSLEREMMARAIDGKGSW